VSFNRWLTWIVLQYAIRPSARNNSEFKRDAVIKQVADAVGSNHKVDLSNYDHCILVETFKVCWHFP
jgi:tRNA acetyltransferase TAN1